MHTNKITDDEIKDMKVASLPTRPTAPSSFGGRGYTAKEMKEAFDRLPLFIVERLNSLIDDITEDGGASIAKTIETGFFTGHTLSRFFADIKTGAASGYIKVYNKTLAECITEIRQNITEIRKTIEEMQK